MRHPFTSLADELRHHATIPERRLWRWLVCRPGGWQFRRQVPLGRYIVDFACHAAKLAVEVDGEHHELRPADAARDNWLRDQGWEVARYWNREVRFNLEGVLADVDRRLAERGEPRRPALSEDEIP